eukprot:Selendium_serpulae@DN10493_c0_g1_i1.p1
MMIAGPSAGDTATGTGGSDGRGSTGMASVREVPVCHDVGRAVAALDQNAVAATTDGALTVSGRSAGVTTEHGGMARSPVDAHNDGAKGGALGDAEADKAGQSGWVGSVRRERRQAD